MTNYSKACQYSTRLIEKLKSLDTQNKLDFDFIDKAVYWAKKYHDGQFRKSGELFYSHPLEVAYMISDHLLKTDVIVASILHDIVEDTEVTIGMILDEFGWRIAEIVDMLTRDRPDGTKLSVEQILHNAYEQNDEEVILIKGIDRLHNLSTIHFMQEKKKQKTVNQALEFFFAYCFYLDNRNLISSFVEEINKTIDIKLEYKDSINLNHIPSLAPVLQIDSKQKYIQ
jgi:guanosine-3',5'-bis(diphosphate) 3'-pyrophosphohydrolase